MPQMRTMDDELSKRDYALRQPGRSVYCERSIVLNAIVHRLSSIVRQGTSTMIKAAVLTLSDRSFAGERDDLSGAIVTALLRDRLGIKDIHCEVLPDEQPRIEETL